MGDTTYYLNKREAIKFQGHQYFTHASIIQGIVSQHAVSRKKLALINQGANGFLCGDDMFVLERNERFVDVSGMGGHRENQLYIVTAQTLIAIHKDDVIAVFHQTAFIGKGENILSCLQLDFYGGKINGNSLRFLTGT
jgi:hypothetical protein